MIKDLLNSVIDINILINLLRRFFIDLLKSSVLVNDVVYSVIFLFNLTVIVVAVLVDLKLIVLICDFIIIHSDLLRVVRSVPFFISLIVE